MTAIIPSAFPISSQTSISDKEVLLKIKQLLGQLPSYTFLEIGSYLGGSMTPFLADANCTKILSIDERERQQPDERGARYDYSGITHDTMIENLQSHGFNTDKLEVFDGSISQYPKKGEAYDFIFIDGEHTDWACFRDYIHAEKFFKHDCIVAFHDTNLVYKAIKIINELLGARNAHFKFIKIKDSAMSCLFFNQFANVDLDTLFLAEPDLDKFYLECEAGLLLAAARNRITITKPWRGEAVYSVKDAPLLSQ
jgi:hypothetical protein